MQKRLARALALLAVAVPSMPALAQALGGRPDYQHYGWDWGWGHMIFGSLMMVLFWGGIILVVVLAVRWLGGSVAAKETAGGGTSALDVLDDRFARGEIDKAEYEERKRALSG